MTTLDKIIVKALFYTFTAVLFSPTATVPIAITFTIAGILSNSDTYRLLAMFMAGVIAFNALFIFPLADLISKYLEYRNIDKKELREILNIRDDFF